MQVILTSEKEKKKMQLTTVGLPLSSGQNNLTAIVNRMLKDVPRNANSLGVFVYVDGLHPVVGGQVESDRGLLQVEFRSALLPNSANTACVGYSEGNFESFVISPTGCLDD